MSITTFSQSLRLFKCYAPERVEAGNGIPAKSLVFAPWISNVSCSRFWGEKMEALLTRLLTRDAALTLCSTVLLLLGRPSASFAQSAGRFEEAKRIAQQYLDSNQFDKAAAKLEEVWEQDKTDPAVAENLGLAYLNGDDRRYNPEVVSKAVRLMQEAVKLGGKASFLVQHKHEGKIKVLAIGGDSLKYCNGKLSISHGSISFVMKQLKGAEDHSFETTPEQVKVTGPGGSGEFKLARKADKAATYTLVPRNGIKDDTDILLTMMRGNQATDSTERNR